MLGCALSSQTLFAIAYPFPCEESLETLYNNLGFDLPANTPPEFRQELIHRKARELIIEGDVAEAEKVAHHLLIIAETLKFDHGEDFWKQVLNGAKSPPVKKANAAEVDKVRKELASLESQLKELKPVPKSPLHFATDPAVFYLAKGMGEVNKVALEKATSEELEIMMKAIHAFRGKIAVRTGRQNQVEERKNWKDLSNEEHAFSDFTSAFTILSEQISDREAQTTTHSDLRDDLVATLGGWNFSHWDEDKMFLASQLRFLAAFQGQYRQRFFEALANEIPPPRSLATATKREIKDAMDIASHRADEVPDVLEGDRPKIFHPLDLAEHEQGAALTSRALEFAEAMIEDPDVPGEVRAELQRGVKFYRDLGERPSPAFIIFVKYTRDLLTAQRRDH